MQRLNFRPMLIDSLKGYTRQGLTRDLLAGLIVGIVALPMAIAFAIASGVSPEVGLVTAVLGGLIVSALGGSSVQIGGPTGAFIIIVLSIIGEYGQGGLLIATLMAGILLLLIATSTYPITRPVRVEPKTRQEKAIAIAFSCYSDRGSPRVKVGFRMLCIRSFPYFFTRRSVQTSASYGTER